MMMNESPFKEGDWVTMALSNGVNEGIIWKVLSVKGTKKSSLLVISPFFTATGASVRNNKTVSHYEVKLFTLLDMCALRQHIDNVINDHVKKNAKDDVE